jgi:predicted metal-dependent hydrolase
VASDGWQLDLFAPAAPSTERLYPAPAAAPTATPKAAPTAAVAAPVVAAIGDAAAPATVPAQPTDALPLASPPGTRRLMLGQQPLAYRLARSKRRTIGFMIDDDGLRITAPKWIGIREIENAIREKQRWILSKLHERRERDARRLTPQMQWCDGASLPYLGQLLTLRVTTGAVAGDGIAHDAEAATLSIALPADAGVQQLKDRVQAWLQREARILFAARLPIYAARLEVTYRSFALSSATTQWGSCTADGRIRLNWRLMHFPLQQIDYVIAHELSHLREMNHSPRFWATVELAFPEFEAAKKALRAHAPENLPVF